jgi:putative ABC transport system permease protein
MLTIIALRNLARNQRRTLLALLVVSAGTAALLMTAGFVRYSFQGLSEAIISGGLGHLEIIPVDSLGDSPGAVDRAGQPPRMESWTSIQSEIEARAGVRGTGATIQFAGVATHGDRSASFMGLGVQPDRLRVMQIQTKIRAGTGLPERELGEGEESALLGVGLARALGAEPGATVTVMVVTETGSLNALDLHVAGLVSTGFQDLDARILEVRVTTALRLLATDRITSLVVVLDDRALVPALEAELNSALADRRQALAVVGWEARAPFYTQVRGLYLGIFVFLGGIIAVLVALSTANTILMSIIERTREFGTLLAIGTARPQLAVLVLLEANWIAVLGSALGCLMGLAAATGINAAGIKMPPPPAAVDPIDLALTVMPQDYGLAVALMLVVLSLAAVPPAVRLFRIEIVDAIGHV